MKLFVSLLLAGSAFAADPAVLKSEFIFDPNPVPSCHATTIAETPGGLVAAWFAGSAEGKPDVGIWSSHQENGAWSKPVQVATGVQEDSSIYPCWNPVLFQPRDKPLMLFYKIGPSPSTWWGELRTSTDNGKTWGIGKRLPNGNLGPIKNKPVLLADGSLLCPTSTETPTKPSAWRLHFERTEDWGTTFSTTRPKSEGTPPIDAIQPSILFLGGEKIMALGRTRQKKLFSLTSEDQGKTWGDMSLIDLPNPNSGTDAVTLKDGRHLLIYNHTERGRSPLNVAVSNDGKAWNAALVLEDEPKMEFSYPAIIQTSDGLVHATYTWKRKLVKHVVIDPAKLAPKPIVNGIWPTNG